MEGVKVRLQIWDTAGQERFKTITQTYYRGAMGIILTYSVAERDSFIDIENWVKQIKMHASDSVFKVLVGNKCDMPDRAVSTEEGQRLAQELNMHFYETSAKENTNIEEVFLHMAKNVKATLDKEEKVGVFSYTGSKITKNQDKREAKEDCC